MTRKFFYLTMLLLCVSFTACDENEYSKYDADTAESPYKPIEGRRPVASVKTTNTIDGRDYSWEHKFSYDKHGRIKEINSQIVHHHYKEAFGYSRYYRCNISSKANYYYLGNAIDIVYEVEREYPDYPDWNTSVNGKDEGRFNANGTLGKYSVLDFEYSATSLYTAHIDGGRRYDIVRGRGGNITGYKLYDELADTLIADLSEHYEFSYDKNKTNFDFSGYFGYWGAEQEIPINSSIYYAPYQLAAFGMLGAGSQHLPLGITVTDSNGNETTGKWELDSEGYPLSFTDAYGRKTFVTYK